MIVYHLSILKTLLIVYFSHCGASTALPDRSTPLIVSIGLTSDSGRDFGIGIVSLDAWLHVVYRRFRGQTIRAQGNISAGYRLQIGRSWFLAFRVGLPTAGISTLPFAV